MRVVIGVNGIGVGHSIRQRRIADELVRAGAEVTVLSTGRGLDFFSNFDDVELLEAYMPRFISKRNSLDWGDTIKHEWSNIGRILSVGGSLFGKVKSADAFVSDYEPYSAYLAHAARRPLFTVDQQSKYRYYRLPSRSGYSQSPERQRLAMFAPTARHAYIGTFAPPGLVGLTSPRRAGRLSMHPAVLSTDVREAAIRRRQGEGPSRRRSTVVYFSSYFSQEIGASVEAVISAARQIGDRSVTVFTTGGSSKSASDDDHVHFRDFSRDAFLDELLHADSVVTTAGFNLISECVALGVPLLCVPVGTYDQQWCAEAINALGIGAGVPSITTERVIRFFHDVDHGSVSVRDALTDFVLSEDSATAIVADLLGKL